jgi:hypothetical protein
MCAALAVVVVLVFDSLVHAPRGVLETGLGTALGAWLWLDVADITELELAGGALDGARFFVAPMATFFHHGRSPGSGGQ